MRYGSRLSKQLCLCFLLYYILLVTFLLSHLYFNNEVESGVALRRAFEGKGERARRPEAGWRFNNRFPLFSPLCVCIYLMLAFLVCVTASRKEHNYRSPAREKKLSAQCDHRTARILDSILRTPVLRSQREKDTFLHTRWTHVSKSSCAGEIRNSC